MQGFYINVFYLWTRMLTNQNYTNMLGLRGFFGKWISTDALLNFGQLGLHHRIFFHLGNSLCFKLGSIWRSKKVAKHCRCLYMSVLLWGFCLFVFLVSIIFFIFIPFKKMSWITVIYKTLFYSWHLHKSVGSENLYVNLTPLVILFSSGILMRLMMRWIQKLKKHMKNSV